MLVCRACLRRASAPILKATQSRAPTQSHILERVALPQTRRAVATLSINDEEGGSSPAADAILPNQDERQPPKALERAVRKQLEYLRDPFKIAEHVEATLQKNRFEEAVLLTRKASRDGKVTVSWNHLIQYQMQNQRLNAALKLFNEMKKRAQLPNAQTYTIIFKGCAQSSHPKLAVSEAVRIYHTMLTNERMKPNTIHLNAVLHVCARAGDIDTLFSILHTVTDGSRSPNNQTYTIVLNALRPVPDRASRTGLTPEELKSHDGASMQKAKAIWEAVIADWKNAKIRIDEQLVCSMGRVLLAGDYFDNDSILDLVEQTMKLPRLDRVKGKLPPAAKPRDGEPQGPEDDDFDLDSVGPASPADAPSTGYAEPGNSTLSLILTALGATRKTSLAPRYWKLLTERYGVRPDADNYTRMLRVLHLGRGSGKAAELIEQMPPEHMTPAAFLAALRTCIRDNLNPNAFRNANRVFDVMVANTRHPAPLALRAYLAAARANFARFRDHAGGGGGGGPHGGKFGLGRQIVAAVDRMWGPFRVLANSFSYPQRPSRSPEEEHARSANARSEAVAVARRMVAALDHVITEGMAAPETVRILKSRRNVLNRFVTRHFEREQLRSGGKQGEASSQEPGERTEHASEKGDSF